MKKNVKMIIAGAILITVSPFLDIFPMLFMVGLALVVIGVVVKPEEEVKKQIDEEERKNNLILLLSSVFFISSGIFFISSGSELITDLIKTIILFIGGLIFVFTSSILKNKIKAKKMIIVYYLIGLVFIFLSAYSIGGYGLINNEFYFGGVLENLYISYLLVVATILMTLGNKFITGKNITPLVIITLSYSLFYLLLHIGIEIHNIVILNLLLSVTTILLLKYKNINISKIILLILLLTPLTMLLFNITNIIGSIPAIIISILVIYLSKYFINISKDTARIITNIFVNIVIIYMTINYYSGNITALLLIGNYLYQTLYKEGKELEQLSITFNIIIYLILWRNLEMYSTSVMLISTVVFASLSTIIKTTPEKIAIPFKVLFLSTIVLSYIYTNILHIPNNQIYYILLIMIFSVIQIFTKYKPNMFQNYFFTIVLVYILSIQSSLEPNIALKGFALALSFLPYMYCLLKDELKDLKVISKIFTYIIPLIVVIANSSFDYNNESLYLLVILFGIYTVINGIFYLVDKSYKPALFSYIPVLWLYIPIISNLNDNSMIILYSLLGYYLIIVLYKLILKNNRQLFLSIALGIMSFILTIQFTKIIALYVIFISVATVLISYLSKLKQELILIGSITILVNLLYMYIDVLLKIHVSIYLFMLGIVTILMLVYKETKKRK